MYIRSVTMKPKQFEFKFDDTRLSSIYKNKIALRLKVLLLRPDIPLSLPCWLSQFSFTHSEWFLPNRVVIRDDSNTYF